MKWDVIVVGGGSAGLAAACSAAARGAQVALLERERFLGGVLPQCVHDGFGLHMYKESLSGPEYAERWSAQVAQAGVEVLCSTTVLEVTSDRNGIFTLDCVGAPLGGRCMLRAHSVVVATGCRERTRGQLLIAGTRPAGVLTAGTAQYMMNVENQLPGDKVVVLGSGDIGLIMARRFTLEGAQVRLVLGQEATGLLRNHVRCCADFNIPVRYGWGVMRIHGKERLAGVSVAPYREDGSFDEARREYVRCNVLLLACGLLPEREIVAGFAGGTDTSTVNGTDAGEDAGLFICGNANAPCDLVDEVTQDGLEAGTAAAAWAAHRANFKLRELPKKLHRMMQLHIGERRGKLSDFASVRDLTGYSVCTVCPQGCVLHTGADGAVEGARCERGRAFALQEATEPLRIFTGTVKIAGSDLPLLPVKTSCEVPLQALRAVGRATRRVRAAAPVQVGDVVVRNVAHTGADLIATASRAKVECDG